MSARRPRRVHVTARAKLNLSLAVGPKRPDGFHDLVSVFQSVSLADELVAERTARGFSLEVAIDPASGLAAGDIPRGGENLVLRAARLVRDTYGLSGGCRFRLRKRIPAQAGMGGGSADAAAAIAAMLALHGLRPRRAERIALAARVGSDVPFAITGGTALGTGRGENLRQLRLARAFEAVIVMPEWRVSTAAAFARIDSAKYGLTLWEHASRFAASLGRKELTTSRAARLGNTFERVLGRQEGDFEALRARMRAAGLPDPHLTGSGSAVFGIVPAGSRARAIADRLAGTERVFTVRSAGRGLVLRSHG